MAPLICAWAHSRSRGLRGVRASWRAVVGVGPTPIRHSAENSRVVATLRVATACYIMVQRTLHNLRFWKPKGSRHAVVGCFSQRSTDRLLLRTSENNYSTHSGE